MREPEFKPGQVVILKSGGPLMTIQCVAAFPVGVWYTCNWFTKKDRFCAGEFIEETLRLAPNQ